MQRPNYGKQNNRNILRTIVIGEIKYILEINLPAMKLFQVIIKKIVKICLSKLVPLRMVASFCAPLKINDHTLSTLYSKHRRAGRSQKLPHKQSIHK